MKRQKTLPRFGELVPYEGGLLGGIMRGGLLGGVRQPDYALIVPTVAAVILPWGKYDEEVPGADSLTDGLANTTAMLKLNCPPAVLVTDLSIGGKSDFYLPARGELWALRSNVPELFDKALHWSSTQSSRSYAIVQDFEYGGSYWYRKALQFRVRPVRRIPLYHFPA